MKWLQGNLAGVVLLSACGALVLVALALFLAWRQPSSAGIEFAPGDVSGPMIEGVDLELGPFGEYRIVMDMPLFSETRQPAITAQGAAEEPEAEAPQVEVAEMPDVTLRGVIITPEIRLASLAPADGGEALVFREGVPMPGDLQGWVIREIRPRTVLLESLDGGRHELELAVHDQRIKPPPPAAKPAAAAGEAENEAGQEPLSRAEEIRQRIAERREQLRQQAAEDQAADEPELSPYQQAIRNLINNPENNKDDDDGD